MKKTKPIKSEDLPGYPHYPVEDDIYGREKEEKELNPENPSKKKSKNPDPDKPNELNFRDDVSGGDLDVPGAELDDEMENIGSEDEENNYYSLGGDNHENQEENNGEL
ncbi:MAG: hypothetical protein ACKOXB_06905 [Flavobacteriales bacterium]